MLSKGVRNTAFIKDVRISAGEVADNYVRLEYERENILDNRRVNPYVIYPLTLQFSLNGSGFYGFEHRFQTWVEWHHHRHKGGI